MIRAEARRRYLGSRHFAITLTLALTLHGVAGLIWSIMPHQPVFEIPVRILNIKLGDMIESDVDAFTPEPPDAKEMSTASQPLPSSVASASATKQKASRPMPQDAKAPVVPPTPQAAENAVSLTKAAKRFMRSTAFDYSLKKDLATLAPRSGNPLGTSRQAKQEAIKSYEQLISAAYKSKWYYPPEARMQNMQGRARVRIQLDRRGNVRNVAIEQRTGYELLDRVALDMVRQANPFPPMPEDYPAGEVKEFILPAVDFILEKKP